MTISCTSSSAVSLESPSLSTTDKHVTFVLTDDQPSDSCNDILPTLNEPSMPKTTQQSRTTTNSAHPADMEIRPTNKTAKLERRLSNLSKVIRELEAKDLSLDEMQHSDLYEVEANLKKRAYNVIEHEVSLTDLF